MAQAQSASPCPRHSLLDVGFVALHVLHFLGANGQRPQKSEIAKPPGALGEIRIGQHDPHSLCNDKTNRRNDRGPGGLRCPRHATRRQRPASPLQLRLSKAIPLLGR